MTEIRLARIDELDAVSKLSHEFEHEKICWGLYGDPIEHYIKKDIFIAVVNDNIVGYAYGTFEIKTRDTSFYKNGDKLYFLDEIYIKKEYRSNGIGSLLFKKCEEYAKENGAKYFELTTATKDYEKMFNFYIKMMGLEYWSAQLIKKL